mgnify:CR=1 FL=1
MKNTYFFYLIMHHASYIVYISTTYIGVYIAHKYKICTRCLLDLQYILYITYIYTCEILLCLDTKKELDKKVFADLAVMMRIRMWCLLGLPWPAPGAGRGGDFRHPQELKNVQENARFYKHLNRFAYTPHPPKDARMLENDRFYQHFMICGGFRKHPETSN